MNNENNKNNLQTYFTEEINKKISEMSNADMVNMLKELENTGFWIAVLKYSQDRAEVARNGLYSLDPIKEPSQICRLQGMVTWLYDLISAVIEIKNKAEEKNTGIKVD